MNTPLNVKVALSLPKQLFVLICILTFPASDVHSQDRSRPRFDLSGIEQFLEITALLSEDLEPSVAQWDELFNTSGYRTLRDHESGYNPDFFKKRFNLVFRPSMRDQLEARLSQLEKSRASSWYDGMEYRVLRHYCRVRDARSELLTQCESFRNSAMCEEACRLAAEYLPAGAMDSIAEFSFLIFAPDARGYSPILLDLGYVMFHPNHTGLVAHELHHYYIHKLWKFNSEEVDEQDHQLLHSLGQIYKEGIADQIDKPALHYSGEHTDPLDEERSRAYRLLVQNTPALLHKLDEFLADMALHPDKRYELGRRFAAAVPQSGHPTGFYMARTIVEELGKEALVKDVGNPFAFVRKFNRAVKKKGPEYVSFSDEAMFVIARLEKKYVVDGYSRILDLGPSDPPISGIDLRSVDHFFRIVSLLESEQEPTSAQWCGLFATYGYHDLIKDEGDQYGREHHFKKYLRLVFKPSVRDGLEAELGVLQEQDRWRWRDVIHLCKVRENKSSLIAYVKTLRDPSTYANAMKIATQYLPNAALKGQPCVCFLVFSNDTRGSLNYADPVLVDLLLAQQSPLGPVKFTARWFWYHFAGQNLAYDLSEVDDHDLPVLQQMFFVYREGIANLIGKSYNLILKHSQSAERVARFRERLAAMSGTIAELDSHLVALVDESSDREEIGRKFAAAVPGRGDELGYHMAKTIIEVWGIKALQNVAGNPFAFFRVFNKATTESDAGARGFSNEGMKVLLNLEEKYVLGDCQGR
jgi:hypothetical protein